MTSGALTRAAITSLAIGAVSLAVARPLEAHPASTTTAAVVIAHDGAFEISVVTDALSLIAKLDAIARDPIGQPPPPDTVGMAARIEALNDMIAARVDLCADNQRLNATL